MLMKEMEKAIDYGQIQPEIPEVTCCKPAQHASERWVFNADMLWGIWRTAKQRDGCMLRK